MAITAFLVFGILVDMSSGATYSVVPFVNKKALGAVAGIVGAGGNAGEFAAGFLFKTSPAYWPTALLALGMAVTLCSFPVLTVRMPSETEPQPATSEIRPALSGLAGA